MNEKQIAFIICANNAQFYNECVWYIDRLVVPEGYSIDILCIQEAESMAEGYNAGMKASDAKYKVYLHQDTFILNTQFIEDMIGIFKSDNAIGMIGVLGTDKLPRDASCYLAWNVGNVMAYNGANTIVINKTSEEAEKYTCVDAIDGLIMATQYDVDWREDILSGWDFYDVSQSLEMKRKGYKVVVPYQSKAWCYHDCGASKLSEYDKYRKVVMQEYSEFFCVNEWEQGNEESYALELAVIREKLVSIINTGMYDELVEMIQGLEILWPRDTQIREIFNVMEIYWLEKENKLMQHSEFFDGREWESIYEYYKWIVFTLRRIEYGYIDEEAALLKEKVDKGFVSQNAVQKIMGICLEKNSNANLYLLGSLSNPLVSVILPVYNGEGFVHKTIDSILNQTYQNIELIIIDDASTDNSKDVISMYKDDRIKTVFLPKNNNVCYSGNVGFQIAHGEYIALIGHDDIWVSDKLEKQIAFMEVNKSFSVCFSWVDIIDENEKVINDKYSFLYEGFCRNNLSREQWIKRMLVKGNSFCAPSACIRSDKLKEVGHYRYGLLQLQDYELWLRLLKEGNFYIIKEKLVQYRRFTEEGKNISEMSVSAVNRDLHEKQWVFDTYVWEMSNLEFANVFKDDMRNSSAQKKEVLCEKAFLIWDSGNCFAERHFMDLFEDEECRDIFEKKYQFTLQDFYKMNAKTRMYDTGLM